MKVSLRMVPVGFFLVFPGAVAYWADTDTMPAGLQALAAFPNGDRVGHFVLYGVLAGLLTWALPHRHPLVGVLIAGGIAALEEATQLFMAHRTPDWVDLGCGFLGIATAQLLFAVWRRPTPGNRSRPVYAVLVLVIIALGLASRARFVQPVVGQGVGDALWALMVFLGIGWLWPKLPTGRAAVCALLFAWLIEFSQLYQAPWIDAVRQTTVGGLVLGHGFLWTDLVCYAAGVAAAAAGEWAVARYGMLRPR
jgi:VanZ family protein